MVTAWWWRAGAWITLMLLGGAAFLLIADSPWLYTFAGFWFGSGAMALAVEVASADWRPCILHRWWFQRIPGAVEGVNITCTRCGKLMVWVDGRFLP